MTWLLCSMLVWFLSACEEEILWNETESIHSVSSYLKTGDLTAIGGTGVTIKGSVTIGAEMGEVQEYGIAYSQNSLGDGYGEGDMGDAIAVAGVGDKNDFTVNLTGLSFKTTYYYRTYVKMDGWYYFGKEKNFITLPVDVSTIMPADLIVTERMNESFRVSSNLGISGSLDDLNCESGFCWKIVNVPFTEPVLGEEGTENTTVYRQPEQNNAFESDIYASEWRESEGAVYAVRSYFKINVDDTEQVVYSNTILVAKSAGKQVSSVLKTVDATETSVTFQAVATGFDGENIVEKGFCYSQTNSSPVNGGKDIVVKGETSSLKELITATIKGLDSNQYYYVRAYCKSETGEVMYSPTYIYGASWATVTLTDPIIQVSETETKFTVSSNLEDSHNVLDGMSYEVGFCWKEVGANYSDPILGESGVESSNVWPESSSFTRDVYISSWSTNLDRIYAVRAYFKVTIDDEEKVLYSSTAFAVKTTEPILSPLSVVSVNGDAVTFRTMTFNFENMEITEKGYCYSQIHSNPVVDVDSKVSATTEGNVIEATITGLDISDNKFYHIRPYYVVGGTTYYGETQIYGTRLAGIYTLEDLVAFRYARKNGTDVSWWKNEKNEINLYADIDLSSIDNWVPIRMLNSDETFNGNNHTLSNLKVVEYNADSIYDSSVGLFGVNDGIIKDLHIAGEGNMINLDLNVNGFRIGGICGQNRGTVTDCSSNVAILIKTSSSSDAYVGGLIGYNYNGKVLNDSVSSNVSVSSTTSTAGLYVGGLVGRTNGELTNCIYTGEVYGQSLEANVGGIVASAENGTIISDCLNKGKVGNGLQCNVIGGIVGQASSLTIKHCVNEGRVVGHADTQYMGGIVGHCLNSYYGNNLIDQCINRGNLEGGKKYVGGIAGWIQGGVTNCTNEVAIDVQAEYLGAICGYVGENVNHFVNNSNTSSSSLPLIGQDSRPPLVGAVTVSEITSTSVTLSAQILDMGGVECTSKGFTLSTQEGAYGDEKESEATVEAGQIKLTITGLTPGTQYFVRAFARNDYARVYSEVESFTTDITVQ